MHRYLVGWVSKRILWRNEGEQIQLPEVTAPTGRHTLTVMMRPVFFGDRFETVDGARMIYYGLVDSPQPRFAPKDAVQLVSVTDKDYVDSLFAVEMPEVWWPSESDARFKLAETINLARTEAKNGGKTFWNYDQLALLGIGAAQIHPQDTSITVPDVELPHPTAEPNPEDGSTIHDRLQTTDAMVWAKEFLKVWDDPMNAPNIMSDDGRPKEGWLVGWFANAIERGRMAQDAYYKRELWSDGEVEPRTANMAPVATPADVWWNQWIKNNPAPVVPLPEIELWLAYYGDWSGMALFNNELDCLRYALAGSMQVARVKLGVDLRDQVK